MTNTMANAELPPDVPTHAETSKLAEKIGPFRPTSGRAERQLLSRRYVTQIVFRTPTVAERPASTDERDG